MGSSGSPLRQADQYRGQLLSARQQLQQQRSILEQNKKEADTQKQQIDESKKSILTPRKRDIRLLGRPDVSRKVREGQRVFLTRDVPNFEKDYRVYIQQNTQQLSEVQQSLSEIDKEVEEVNKYIKELKKATNIQRVFEHEEKSKKESKIEGQYSSPAWWGLTPQERKDYARYSSQFKKDQKDYEKQLAELQKSLNNTNANGATGVEKYSYKPQQIPDVKKKNVQFGNRIFYRPQGISQFASALFRRR